ncbi:hypothetical protein NC653_024950 [Populus alba x Populus x berolinensis]|uniref:Uncharacterized protein n=1 Tax=Populus alba x Populus x berolinensis TaxID=444605 RepID=A0AAD6MAX0_9ROSI|nr:hypothetical protein NC653_024950 [Populus alba x Populus x berolinensis]
MVNQVVVAAHTSVVDSLEFDTSLQWKAKLADFILRKEKNSQIKISYNVDCLVNQEYSARERWSSLLKVIQRIKKELLEKKRFVTQKKKWTKRSRKTNIIYHYFTKLEILTAASIQKC